MYNRFWDPGMFWARPDRASSFAGGMGTGADLASPGELFELPAQAAAPSQGPWEAPQLFWETTNKLGSWIATDRRAGIVALAEQFPNDKKWYLMQAPLSGHLPPQKVQLIADWRMGLVETPDMLAGDLLAWATAGELATLRHGHRLEVGALRAAQLQVEIAYDRLFAALDEAGKKHGEDDSVARHRDTHHRWLAAHE